MAGIRQEPMDRVQKIAAGSIAVGLLVLGLKFLAWRLTGSIALYSDALESIVNVVTAVVALLAVRTSAKPADASHPYGHGKAEYFSAVIVGVLIVVAALLILKEAWHGFRDPRPLDASPAGLLVNGLASVVNGVWCWVLIHRGRRLRSPALVADGRHLLTDVVSSVSVLLGVLLAAATGWSILDPALAALVAGLAVALVAAAAEADGDAAEIVAAARGRLALGERLDRLALVELTAVDQHELAQARRDRFECLQSHRLNSLVPGPITARS